MIVECIDDNYDVANQIEVVKNILKVGDDFLLPKKGKQYEVFGYAHYRNGITAYILLLGDYTPYGIDHLTFNKEGFKIIEEASFIPNTYISNEYYEGLAREVIMYIELF